MSGPAEEPILLVAVSARMLAELAVGAGHDVVALDRFGDLDLQRLCRSVSVLRDLGGRGRMADLVEAADGIGAPSVVYGAGLENQPALVERLARGRRLLGTPPEALERVRDPAVLGASLRGAGFSHPPTFRPGEAPRGDRRRWLRKPVLGGGGRGIREWRGGALPGNVVVQERIAGVPCSAAAVGDGRSAALLGVTEQLIGHRALGGRGFAWCGNVVPARLPEAERRALAQTARTICSHLAAAFGLRGLFGIDLIWDGERAWVLEVNPRPTGSLEAVQAAHGTGVFAAHLAACAGRLPPGAPDEAPPRAAGKAILFATRDMQVGDTRGWPARGIRDVPHPAERIGTGQPICTLLSAQGSPDAVVADLEQRAAALRAELHERDGVRAPA